eukprot:jgi/Mesvir1/8632/Mv02581-RA.1
MRNGEQSLVRKSNENSQINFGLRRINYRQAYVHEGMASCEDLEKEITQLSHEIDILRNEDDELENRETANLISCDDILLRLSEVSFRKELAQLATAGDFLFQDTKRRESYDREVLGALRAFTGLDIEEATCVALSPDERVSQEGQSVRETDAGADEPWRRRRYAIKGGSHGLRFVATFDFHERVLRVENLRVWIPPFVPPELAPFLACVEADGSLRTFFKGFVRFAELAHERTSLFRSLIAAASRRDAPHRGTLPAQPAPDGPRKRPRRAGDSPTEHAALRGGRHPWVLVPFGAGTHPNQLCGYSDTLIISPPAGRCQLYFTWKLSLGPDGSVSQKFDLAPRMSGLPEGDSFVEGIAKRFNDMCSLAGPTAALRAVFRCTQLGAE